MKVLIVEDRVVQLNVTEYDASVALPPNVKIIDAPPFVLAGWSYRNNNFAAPHASGTLDPPFHANYENAQLAKRELVLTDRLVCRFYEEGDPVAPIWVTYRIDLRAIIQKEFDTSSPPTPLPIRPPLPYGLGPTMAW